MSDEVSADEPDDLQIRDAADGMVVVNRLPKRVCDVNLVSELL